MSAMPKRDSAAAGDAKQAAAEVIAGRPGQASRRWLGVTALVVFVLVLLRGSSNQNRSPNHASISDAPDGTSALRAYADALGHQSGSVEGDFNLPSSPGLLFVFTPRTGFTKQEAQRLATGTPGGGSSLTGRSS